MGIEALSAEETGDEVSIDECLRKEVGEWQTGEGMRRRK
jgi:hypothetical protein